ncbi:hypothetical protein ACLI09_05575 [Flavobacterium sp. RHBU_24]|uniref:hypothetical protein n=1 Tax=Flavobacterium sp. RHBU_24 TaxID=3391185 RepID=UPI0039847A5E
MKQLLFFISILSFGFTTNAFAQGAANYEEEICGLHAVPDYNFMLVKLRAKLEVLQTELRAVKERKLIAQKSLAVEIKSDKTASQAKYQELTARKADAVIKMVQQRIQATKNRIEAVEKKSATRNPK